MKTMKNKPSVPLDNKDLISILSTYPEDTPIYLEVEGVSKTLRRVIFTTDDGTITLIDKGGKQ